MTERKVIVSERYHPGGRTVIVDDIPAAEVTAENESHVLFDADVVERIRILVHRALAVSDAPELRITYSASDAAARY